MGDREQAMLRHLKMKFNDLCSHKLMDDKFYRYSHLSSDKHIDHFLGSSMPEYVEPVFPFETSLFRHVQFAKFTLKDTVKPVSIDISNLGDFENTDNGAMMVVTLSSFTNPADREIVIFPFRVSSALICMVSYYSCKAKGSRRKGRAYVEEDYFLKKETAWENIDKNSPEVQKRFSQSTTFNKLLEISNSNE